MQFKALCTGNDGLHNSKAYSDFDPSRAIEHKCDQNKAREQLNKIRKLMNIRSK